MSAYISLAPYYDVLTRDVDYGAFVGFYEKIFRRYNVEPETVLDMACGTGTLTCLMAERGYEMIGTDISEDMLSLAAEKAEAVKTPSKPIFIGQAMDELDLYGTVSAAICSLDGINYVEPGGLDEIFRRLRLFVEPGGLFVFDINTPYRLNSQDGEVFIDETDDVFCVWRAEFDRDENACFYGMDIFTRDGETWRRNVEEHVEYAHDPDMLIEKLKSAGFGDISVYGELELSPPEENEGRIFIAARRM